MTTASVIIHILQPTLASLPTVANQVKSDTSRLCGSSKNQLSQLKLSLYCIYFKSARYFSSALLLFFLKAKDIVTE